MKWYSRSPIYRDARRKGFACSIGMPILSGSNTVCMATPYTKSNSTWVGSARLTISGEISPPGKLGFRAGSWKEELHNYSRIPVYRAQTFAPEHPGKSGKHQEPTEMSKQPIRNHYLGHVTGCQPIRDQYILIQSVPGISSGKYNRQSIAQLALTPVNILKNYIRWADGVSPPLEYR
eukprot:sb/3471885/